MDMLRRRALNNPYSAFFKLTVTVLFDAQLPQLEFDVHVEVLLEVLQYLLGHSGHPQVRGAQCQGGQKRQGHHGQSRRHILLHAMRTANGNCAEFLCPNDEKFHSV